MAWELEEALVYYKKQGAPADQNALIALLREIQDSQGGSIPPWIPGRIAEEYRIKEALVLALIRRIPSLRLSNVCTLELCAGVNCGKHKALAEAAEKLRKESGGKIALKFVPCMRMCGKGPNLKWNGKLYHQATEAFLRDLIRQKE